LHAIHLNGWALAGWFLQITFIDMLPKLLMGQWWLWESYIYLLKNIGGIKKYKKRLTSTMAVNKSETTIFNILRSIKLSVNDSNIIRFKP
jgi:hypothetical protein